MVTNIDTATERCILSRNPGLVPLQERKINVSKSLSLLLTDLREQESPQQQTRQCHQRKPGVPRDTHVKTTHTSPGHARVAVPHPHRQSAYPVSGTASCLPFRHNATPTLTSNCRSGGTSIVFKRPTTPTISVSMDGVAVLYFFSNVPAFQHEVININCITIINVLQLINMIIS